MVAFTILLIVLLALAVIAAFFALVWGAGFIVVFGDLVVCGLIIWLLVKLFKRGK